MAQASSITNIVRQMGGSFGVAIFSHMLTQRTRLPHPTLQRSINYTGEVYQQTIDHLSSFAQQTAGATGHMAKSLAEQLIIKRLELEAYIGGINDDFYIAFIVTLLCILPVFWLHRIRKTK